MLQPHEKRVVTVKLQIPQLRDGTVADSLERLEVVDTYRRPNLFSEKERSKTLLLGATP